MTEEPSTVFYWPTGGKKQAAGTQRSHPSLERVWYSHVLVYSDCWSASPRLGGLSDRNGLLRVPEAEKFRVKVLADPLSLEDVIRKQFPHHTLNKVQGARSLSRVSLLIIFRFILFYVYECFAYVYLRVLCPCLVSSGEKRVSGSPEVDGCERGCRKWNPSPLPEWPVLLTVASSPEAFLGLF